MSDMLVGILGLAVIAAIVISLTRGRMLPAIGDGDYTFEIRQLTRPKMFPFNVCLTAVVIALLMLARFGSKGLMMYRCQKRRRYAYEAIRNC